MLIRGWALKIILLGGGVGAYQLSPPKGWALIQGWALNRINMVYLYCTLF